MSEEVMDQVEIKQLNDYAMTKWVGEMQILNSAAMYGTETVRGASSTPTARAILCPIAA
jgi:dTDP-glucose 4,6-dehydratase